MQGGESCLMISRLTDPFDIEAAVAEQRRRLKHKGQPESWADVGTVYEDQYIRIIRDAVRFETGATGTYIRIEFQPGSAGGVVIIPRHDEQFLLVDHYRYATGSSHLEFPRGFLEPNEAPAEGALRELLEETGAAGTAKYLGHFYADSGLIAAPVHVYQVEVGSVLTAETAESITSLVRLDDSAMRAAVAERRINDGMTLAAMAMYLASVSA